MTALSQNKQVLPIDTDTTTILPYTTTQAQANCDPACQMPGSSPLKEAQTLMFGGHVWYQKEVGNIFCINKEVLSPNFGW